MSDNNRLLAIALRVTGVAFCSLYVMAILWPSGWAWHEGGPGTNDYFLMIVGVYATLGLFLIRAAGNPPAHASLIWFTVWSSVVHALVMAYESVRNPMHQGHLIGDVPALLVVALMLGLLMKKQATTG